MPRITVHKVIVGIGEPAPRPLDGRQSETSLAVARGTTRLLAGHGYAALPEVTLASGRRADLLALGPDGSLVIVEIKSSIEDFRTDSKWPEYRAFCDRLFFAIPPHVPAEIMPDDAGLIVADAYGGEILREAPETKLAAGTRKALLIRFAHLAAGRLRGLTDPDGAP